jgi:hypothetical protein
MADGTNEYPVLMGFMDLQHLTPASIASWLEKAESALARNRSTVALVSIPQLLGADGVLATLRARGYAVLEPDAAFDEQVDDSVEHEVQAEGSALSLGAG